MYAPAINIVMSFDLANMQTFLDSDTLSGFIKKSTNEKEDVFIFRNGPASMFLGLEHSYGFGQATGTSVQAPKLRLEFLDPEGTFEDHLLDYSIAASIPDKTNIREFYSNEINRLQQQIDQIENQADAAAVRERLKNLPGVGTDDTNDEFEKELEENEELRKALESQIQSLQDDEAAALGGSEFAAEGLDDMRYRQLLDYQRSFAKRPVWIAYGVGNKLRDWSPAMQFKELTKAEYDFKGEGARVLKMEYDGVGIHPDLDTRYGIPDDFLGALGGGIRILHGKSQRLFNKEQNKLLHDFYSNQLQTSKFSSTSDSTPLFIDKYFGTEGDHIFHISYHETIINVLSSYIKGCTNYENAGVFFPDLDLALISFIAQTRKKIKNQLANWSQNWTQFGGGVPNGLWTIGPDGGWVKAPTADEAVGVDTLRDAIIEIETAKAVFQELGFRFQQDSADREGNLTGISLPSLHAHQDAISNPSYVLEWIMNMDMRVALIGTGDQENYADILQRVSDKLERVMTNYPTYQSVQNFSTISYVETDVKLLDIWFQHGLIPDSNRPAIIYGERGFINSILLGRVFSSLKDIDFNNNGKFSLEIEKLGLRTKSLTHRVSPLSMLRGLDDSYFAALWEYKNPPAWVGPFGDQFAQWNFQSGGSVVMPGMSMTADDTFKSKFKNMPLFSLGTNNPNVLSVSFDVNNLYYAYLNSFGYSTNNSTQAVTTLLPTSVRATMGPILNHIPYGTTTDPAAQAGGTAGAQGDAPDWFATMINPYIMAVQGDTDADTFKSWRYILAKLGQVDLEEIDRLTSGKAQIGGFALPASVSNQEKVKNEFILLLWRAFVSIRNKLPKSTIVIDAPDASLGVIGHSTKLFDKLAKEVLVGNIRTLPYFHLSSYYSTINREALLYSVEPKITNTGNDDFSDIMSQLSWFSGMYEIVGFKHTIRNQSAFSEFLVIRNPLISTQTVGAA